MIHQHYGTQTVNRGASSQACSLSTKKAPGQHQQTHVDASICIAVLSAHIPETFL